jgi:hypothetical protein
VWTICPTPEQNYAVRVSEFVRNSLALSGVRVASSEPISDVKLFAFPAPDFIDAAREIIAQQKVFTENFRPKYALRLSEFGIAFPFPVSEGALRSVSEVYRMARGLMFVYFGELRSLDFFPSALNDIAK